MTNNRVKRGSAADLRRRSEELAQTLYTDVSTLSKGQLVEQLRELQIQQVELQIQNEELRQTQWELTDARDLYSELYDFAPVGYFTLDRTGTVTQCNLTTARLLGAPRDRLVGEKLAGYVQNPSSDDFRRFCRAIFFSGRERESCDLKLRKGEGGRFFGLLVGTAIPNTDGNPLLCRCALLDITHQKVARQVLSQLGLELDQFLGNSNPELRESTRQLSLFARTLEGIQEGIVITDQRVEWPGPEIVFVNKAMTEITGYSAEELIGMTPRLMQGPGTDRTTLERMKSELATGRPFECELKNYRKDGTPYTVEIFVTPIQDAEGRCTNFVGVHRDVTERKRASEELRHEHELSESIINTAPKIVLLLDIDGRIIRFNPFLERLSGWSLEEVQGRDWFETFLPHRDRPDIRRMFERALNGERTIANVNPIVTKDGRERLVEWYDTLLTDSAGELVGLLCIGRDISDQYKAEQELRDSERRLAAFMENRSVIAWMKDEEGKYVFVSENFQNRFQLRLEECRGKTDFELWPREIAVEYRRNDLAVLERNRPLEVIEETTPDGSASSWLITKFPFEDANGRRYVGGLGVDITEQKRVEQELRASNERLRAILDAAADAIVSIDETGMIESVNPATEAMFGYSEDELVGENVRILMPSAHCESQHNYVTHFLEAGEMRMIGNTRETEGRRKDGTLFPVEFSVAQVDNLRWFIGIMRDVSERKASQKKLLQAERLAAIGEAMAGLTHESRNALARSQSNLNRLARRLKGKTDLLEFIQATRKAQQDIARQFEEVRSYAGPVNLVYTSEDLRGIIDEVWAGLMPEREGRNAVLQFADGSADRICGIDRFLMQNAFRNILENALAACNDPVVIDVAFSPEQATDVPSLRISIRDNGPGIPQEVKKRAFDAFFTTKTRGTGLGLAIVKRTVDAHAGSVTLGQGDQPGMEIIITLPRHRSAPSDSWQSI